MLSRLPFENILSSPIGNTFSVSVMSAETGDGRDQSKDDTADDTADIKADEDAAKKEVTCYPYTCQVNREHTSLRSSNTVGFKSRQALISHLKRIHDADSESAKEEALRHHFKINPPGEVEPYRPDRRSDVGSDQGVDQRVDQGVVRDERPPVETLPPPPEKVLKSPPIKKYTPITW